MTDEEKAKTPLSDMLGFWTIAPSFAAGLEKALENSSALQEQIQKNVQAGLRTMNLPTTEDLHRIAEHVAAMQAQLDAIKSAVETTIQMQEEWRKGVEQTIGQLVAFQEEGRRVFGMWTEQMNARLQDFQRLWDEATKD